MEAISDHAFIWSVIQVISPKTLRSWNKKHIDQNASVNVRFQSFDVSIEDYEKGSRELKQALG